jgi:hypothetical protein
MLANLFEDYYKKIHYPTVFGAEHLAFVAKNELRFIRTFLGPQKSTLFTYNGNTIVSTLTPNCIGMAPEDIIDFKFVYRPKY